MIYWVHIARSIDRATLHRERCSEVPSNYTRTDFWEGGWFDYPDKERALSGNGTIRDDLPEEVHAVQALTGRPSFEC